MSWDDIPGWSGFLEIYDLAVDEAQQEGGVIVELGVAFGRSLAYLSRRVIDSGKKIKIYGVDPWWDDWWMLPDQYPTDLGGRPSWGGEYSQWARDQGGPFSAFLKCMATHAPEELERVNVLRCSSADAARMIGPCDLVMIDANHNYESVAQDIALWKPHIKVGKILAGDDYSERDFPGTVRAVKEAFSQVTVNGTTWAVRLGQPLQSCGQRVPEGFEK